MKVLNLKYVVSATLAFVALAANANPLYSQTAPQNPPAKTTENDKKAEPRRILLLPIDAPEGKAEALTDALNAMAQKRFTDKDVYAVTNFDSASALVKRAVIDRQIERKDVEKPFDNVIKAKKLAALLRFKLVLLIAINDYQFNQDKKQVTLDISLRIVDFSGEKPKVEKYVAETATSPATASKDKNEAMLASDLLKELGDKLITDLLKTKPADEGKK